MLNVFFKVVVLIYLGAHSINLVRSGVPMVGMELGVSAADADSMDGGHLFGTHMRPKIE